MNIALKALIATLAVIYSGMVFAQTPVLSIGQIGSNGAGHNVPRNEISQEVSQLDQRSLTNRGVPLGGQSGQTNPDAIYTLDFVAGSQDAAVVQFDLVLNNPKEGGRIDSSSCGGYHLNASNHAVYCNKLDDQRVRVLVDSPTNDAVPTAELGTIRVVGGTLKIDPDSVVVGNAQAQSIDVEVL